MNEPQVWTMVIGTITAFIALVGLIFTWFTRLIRAEFATVAAKFDAIDTKFDAIEAKFDARFEAIDTKLTHLDRDVQALTKHVFHRPE